jgi:hypothetical protein
MVQCRHCQNCRWTIVAGANVCTECGHEYGPPPASELIDRVIRLDEVTAPLAAVAETHAALAQSAPEAERLPMRARLVSANREALDKGVALNPVERLDEELRLSGQAHRTSRDLDIETEMSETGWQVQDSSPLMMWKLPVWAWPLMIVLAGPIDPIIRKLSSTSTKRSRR